MNIPVGFLVIIKCIAANNSTCLYNNIIAYHAMIQNGNIGMNNAIIADNYMITDKSIRHNNVFCPIEAESLIFFDDGVKGRK
jgi:hypothetical protein